MSERETNPAQPLIEPLTRREREILALLAEGLTSPEIADRLTLATSSVKSHVQHLYGKLRASSKREAVAHARELGLLAALAPAAGAGPAPARHPGERLPVTKLPAGLGRPYPTGTLTFLFADFAGLTPPRPVQLEAFKTAPARPAARRRPSLGGHHRH